MDDSNQDLSLETPPVPTGFSPASSDPNSLEASSSGQPPLPGGQAPLDPGPPPKGPSIFQRLIGRFNIYGLLFLLILIVGAGILILTFKGSKGGQGNNNKVSSLTDSQLATLQGSTTVVGSAKQTLDVQSGSIFEGPILARNNIDVAGNIKVGGKLSLPSLNVSGGSTLAGVQVGNDLKVAGAVDIQGQLTLHKGLSVAGTTSFGNLSANVLSATSLQLNGDLLTNRHIVTSGNNLSKTSGSALGRGGTASVNGNDTAGTININTGSSPAAGLFISVTFVHAFSSTPHVIITPVGSAAGSIDYYVNRSSSGFLVGTSSAPPAGKSFAFDYFVIQ